MVLLSLHGLPPAQIAVLLDCHPATVRRWISRFNREGTAGLADRPRCGRTQPGGRRLSGRIAALLARPGRGPWAIGIYLASSGQYTESELAASSSPKTGAPEQGIDDTFILYAGPKSGR
jgi:hypothetical protein